VFIKGVWLIGLHPILSLIDPSSIFIPHTEHIIGQHDRVRDSLEKQLAVFLRQKRGNTTFAQFSKKVGLPASTLHRLEQCQQSITLGRLQQIMSRLKCGLADIFH
jgi:DNA-binding Xre family transcriptional regulator